MKTFEILTFTIIVIIWGITLYKRYSPKIDIIVSGKKYTIILWYYKCYLTEDCERTYIKLFEI